MPPVRRARHADPTESPYPDGWLSYRRRRRRCRRRPVEGNVRGESPPYPATLPDDVLFGIFSRVPGITDAARCAATCRRWGRVVATRAAPISLALPQPRPGGFLPDLAVGAFLQHQVKKDDANRRARGRGAAQLRLVPTAAFASRFLGSFAGSAGAGAHLLGGGARPVASRNGRVVLQLGRQERGGDLTLCVWNPMTGDVAMVPTLSGRESPGDNYACAVLTGDDQVPPLCSPRFFRLLLVYGRRGFTALRSYSSDTGSWGPECKKPGAKIGGRVLRQLGPAVVLHGVAYWLMRHAVFGVRLGSTAAAAAMDVCSVPYRDSPLTRVKLDEFLLGVSSDGRLNVVDVGIMAAIGMPIVSLRTSLLDQDQDDAVDGGDEDINIALPQIKVRWGRNHIKSWWFGEKSGTLIFTAEEETSSTVAVFALNVATRSLEKLAHGDGVANHTCCTRLYGYEMDRAALLASVPPPHY